MRIYTNSDEIKQYVKTLRQSPITSEKIVWSWVRARRMLKLKFRRQHPIGDYILDFYCSEKKIAVEVDGITHSNDAVYERDLKKQQYLSEIGIKTIRIDSLMILNKSEVAWEYLQQCLMKL